MSTPLWVSRADRILASSMREFGRPVTYTPGSTGVPVSLQGVFDEAFVEQDLETGVVTDVGPMLGVRLADIPAEPRANDRLEIAGATYYVQQVQVDGQGGARLKLQAG